VGMTERGRSGNNRGGSGNDRRRGNDIGDGDNKKKRGNDMREEEKICIKMFSIKKGF